jgi:hypothetical protein
MNQLERRQFESLLQRIAQLLFRGQPDDSKEIM